MQKDFWRWHHKKEQLNNTEGQALFHEREVWWCMLGLNIGFEQDGGKDFARPVIILKEFNLEACLIIPLTTKIKKNRYYFPVGTISGYAAVAIMSQIRFIDRKRLALKIATLDQTTFNALRKAIVSVCFSGLP